MHKLEEEHSTKKNETKTVQSRKQSGKQRHHTHTHIHKLWLTRIQQKKNNRKEWGSANAKYLYGTSILTVFLTQWNKHERERVGWECIRVKRIATKKKNKMKCRHKTRKWWGENREKREKRETIERKLNSLTAHTQIHSTNKLKKRLNVQHMGFCHFAAAT